MPLKVSSLWLLMKIVILIILSIGPWIFSEAQSSSSAPVTAILTGLSFPISLEFAPDGRIFFNEKNTGNIRIIQQNGTILSSPFATISPIFTDDESGLLGMALDPSFASNGYVYVYFTYRDSLSYTHGHIIRYTASGNIGTSPANVSDVVSAAPNAPPYHNGGYIKFGPDGKLYTQVGEFHQGSPAQDPSSTTGKMLRMTRTGPFLLTIPSLRVVSMLWAYAMLSALTSTPQMEDSSPPRQVPAPTMKSTSS